MKRMRIVGLCLVAMFAMSALGATAAHAGEYGECVKQAKPYKGGFNDKNCQEANAGKEGKYEWVPLNHVVNFTAKTKTTELVGAAGNIQCSKSSTVGTMGPGSKENHEVITFEGCEFKGPVNGDCHSAGQPGGVIVTNTLTTKLIDHGEKGLSGGEPAAGEVWNQFAGPPSSGIQAEYTCASIVVLRTRGSVSGVFTSGSVNVMSKKALIEFNGVLGESPGKFGEQDLYSEASIGGGPFEPAGPAIEKTTAQQKTAAKVEIKA